MIKRCCNSMLYHVLCYCDFRFLGNFTYSPLFVVFPSKPISSWATDSTINSTSLLVLQLNEWNHFSRGPLGWERTVFLKYLNSTIFTHWQKNLRFLFLTISQNLWKPWIFVLQKISSYSNFCPSRIFVLQKFSTCST